MGSIKLNNIQKSFGSVEVIKDFSLNVADGELVVLVGPSGCGKSTLLRIIAGLEQADSGTIHIDDEEVSLVAPARRGIAMVFQSYALYPHLNVRDNMALGLKQTNMAKDAIGERVEAASHMLELNELLKRRPAELSGGQRQRVAIGRAIVRQPQLFLFDEPLSNLDAALRVNTRLEIARIHRELKATMIYVTHDQTEAMTLADRIVVLNNGAIEQTGTPMEIYRKPATLFVAAFIGSPGMNFIEADAIDAGKPGTIGIRPEHLTLSRETGSWSATVVHSDNLGAETIVYLDADDINSAQTSELARKPLAVHLFGEHHYRAGERVFITPDLSQAHRFDEAGRSTAS